MPRWIDRSVPWIATLMIAGALGSLLIAMSERASPRRADRLSGSTAGKPANLAASRSAGAPGRVPSGGGEPSRASPTAPVYVFDIDVTRTPILEAGRRRFAVLGLGQHADSGRQIVWMRSLSDNRISGFGRGEAIFGSPVRLAAISADAVRFRYQGRVLTLALPPP